MLFERGKFARDRKTNQHSQRAFMLAKVINFAPHACR
jgi:hypothetical protein